MKKKTFNCVLNVTLFGIQKLKKEPKNDFILVKPTNEYKLHFPVGSTKDNCIYFGELAYDRSRKRNLNVK